MNHLAVVTAPSLPALAAGPRCRRTGFVENRDALPLKSNQIDTGAGRQMFGFGRKAGITDQETWTLVIRVAVKMTAEEESTKQVVGMQKAKAILEAECKNLRLRPTTEQREYIEAGMHGLSSTTLTRSLMGRWLKDRHVTITQADIAEATQILESSVEEFLKQHPKK